jgi:ferredoxin-type protein NapH
MGIEILGDVLRLLVLVGLGIAGALAIVIWKKSKVTRVSYIRLVVQGVSLGAIFYLFSYPIPLLYVVVAIFVMSPFLGRLYCGWLCPLGLILDLETLLRKALKKRYRILPDKLSFGLHKSRYIILLVFLLVVPIVLWVLDPPINSAFAVAEAQVLAGPFVSYSILVDPMITPVVSWTTAPLQVGGIYFSFPYTQNIIGYINGQIGQILAIAFVVVMLIGGFLVRRVWCRFCPTGASLAVVNRFGGFKWAPLLHIQKDEEKCTKCGVCKRVCSVQVNEIYEQKGGRINTSQCMVCSRCVEMCPYEGTLKLQLGNKTVFQSRNWLEPSNSE